MSPRRVQLEWGETEETLYHLYQQEQNRNCRRRLQALWLLHQQKTIREVAQTVGVHYRTVQRWLAWYRQGGLAAMCRRRYGGKQPGVAADSETKPGEPTQITRLPSSSQQVEPVTNGQAGRPANEQTAANGHTTAPIHSPDQIISLNKNYERITAPNYQLQADEPLPEGIKRIALEQIDQALVHLTDPSGSRDEAVHEARKCFKKVRAVLRLVRDEIGDEIYRRENICYRDAGRRLAAVRDSAVLIETLDKLTAQFADQLAAETFAGVRARLVARHQSISDRLLDQEKAMVEVAAIIRAARPRVAHWPIVHDDFSALYGGLRRVYSRGRNRLADAYANPSPERFHEWRKRLKYLWYHMRILKFIWPSRLAELINELDHLADCLGEVHDLAQLRRTALDQPELFSDPAEFELLIALIERRCSELEAAARLPGEQIYAEKRKVFVNRLADCWHIETEIMN